MNTEIVKPTPTQGFLDNITKSIEHVLEDLKSNLKFLESLLKTPHLKKNNPILLDIERTCKQLRFAINNLKEVPKTAFVQWSELYDINPYW